MANRDRINDRKWERLPCPRPTPEDECIAAQDEGYLGPSEKSRLERVLSQLPELEVKILVLSTRGMTQRGIADVVGMTQPAVRYHLHRIQRRLQWIHGPGSWFAHEQLYSAVQKCGLPTRDAEIVSKYWDTTSLQHGRNSQFAWRVVQRCRTALWDRAWCGDTSCAVFALGLDELSRWGSQLKRAHHCGIRLGAQ